MLRNQVIMLQRYIYKMTSVKNTHHLRLAYSQHRQKIPSKTFFSLFFRESMIHLGMEKRGTREGSCRTFRTESEEIVSNVDYCFLKGDI